MIVLDTCALIFDALSPNRLGKAAKKAIVSADQSGHLACCDISLWEIGMLIEKGRLAPGLPTVDFLNLLLEARHFEVLTITPEIADFASHESQFKHADPADRLIAASTLIHRGKLVTCDQKLMGVSGLDVIWD